ncbi:hypothetical protein TI05_03550, partial [Achromatium sp. WMS3]
MADNLLLTVATRAVLVGMEEIPVVGGLIKMGRECWQALKNFQEEAAQEERIMQLEQAAALTPTEARDIAQAVIAELRRNGQQIASDQ